MSTKWGIVGAGKISHDFVTAVRTMNSDEHEFVAVAARNKNNAQSFAETHGIPKAYESYEEIAKDPNVDIVYIGIITSQHFPVGILMLENGKHVLMEKPMTLNLKQTKALAEIARKNKRFLMEALWSRFLPSYKHLMKLIKNGNIGTVIHVDASLGVAMMDRERIVKKHMGGGTILDLGIYPLNVVTMVYENEKPLQVVAVGHLNEDGVDLSVTCSLLYSNNRTASITTCGIVELPNEIVITGTKGQIKVPNPMYVATTIVTPDQTYNFPLPTPILPNNYPNSSGLKYEAIEARECLQTGLLESPVMSLKDSELLAEIMDEIRQQVGVKFLED